MNYSKCAVCGQYKGTLGRMWHTCACAVSIPETATAKGAIEAMQNTNPPEMKLKWFEPYLKSLDKPTLERLVAATLCGYDEDIQLDFLEAAMSSQIAAADAARTKLVDRTQAVKLARLGIIDPKTLSDLR